MSEPFFITGLPRTRTAWLANLFTTETTFCHHELIGRVRTLMEFRAAMLTHKNIGDSDSGLLAIWRWVEMTFPKAPWVFVHRPFEEAWASLVKFVTGRPWSRQIDTSDLVKHHMLKSYQAAERHFAGRARCLYVDFSDLGDIGTVEAIWRHCLPDTGWSSFRVGRVELLQDLQIEARQEARPALLSGALVKEIEPIMKD